MAGQPSLAHVCCRSSRLPFGRIRICDYYLMASRKRELAVCSVAGVFRPPDRARSQPRRHESEAQAHRLSMRGK